MKATGHAGLIRLACCLFAFVPLAAADLVQIPGGSFRPFDLKKDQKPVKIRKFLIDRYPVSAAQYAAFLEKNPIWKKGAAPPIKADHGYLKSIDLVKTSDKMVMTQISWFAARAYCEAQGKRLPSLYEWEYVATYNKWDAKPETNARILAWFGRPNDEKNPGELGSGLVSPHGVHDLHGLIWEWVDDFNSSTVTGDSRADTDSESNLFCGATTLSGSDLRNYATYMRYGMRSSLKGNYTGNNLGFRCARDSK